MRVTELPPIRVRLGFVFALLGMFMAILDIQIVASSLNEIQAGISATQDEISWVQTAYLIAEVVMIPLSGLLMRALSTRGIFVVSCLGFSAASLGCALASSLGSLVAMRAVQGFIGGAMIPVAYSISFSIFPQRVMGGVQAVMGLIATSAPAVGPTLGGYITQHLSWHWLFMVNLLPGLIASAGVWLCLNLDRPDFGAFRRIDFFGLGLMAVFLGSLEYVLEEGPGDDWFSNRQILVFSLVALLGALGFFWRTLQARFPIVDLRAFGNRNFAIGTGLGFLLGFAIYGFVYLMPLFFGGIRHLNSLQIGEIILVTGLAMMSSAPIAGRLSDKLDSRLMLALGFTLLGSGAVLNGHLTAVSGYPQFFWPQVIRGAGMVFCMIAVTRIAFGTLPAEELGNASGLFNVMRNLGGAVGLAMIDTLLDQRFDFHWVQIIPSVDSTRTVVVERLQTLQHLLRGSVDHPAAAAVHQLFVTVAMQAKTLAFNDIFLWLGAAYLLAVPLLLFMRKPTKE